MLATSCSPTHVQAAITAAAVNDTVRLPACTYTTWSGTVTIPKALILEGMGMGSTILRRDAVATSSATPMFRVTSVTGVTMRHLQLNGTQDTHPGTYFDVAIELVSSVDFLLYALHIEAFALGIQVTGDPLVQRGVIAASTFSGNACEPCGGVSGTSYAIVVHGTNTAPALTLGTAQNVFIEANTFTHGRSALAVARGARVVFRENQLVEMRENAAAVEIQGPLGGNLGARQAEVYDNTFLNSVPRLVGLLVRGGDGVVFRNRFSSNLTDEVRLTHHPGCTGTYPLAGQIRDLALWDNLLAEGGPAGLTLAPGCATYLQAGRDYTLTARAGYTPYTFPHPLREVLPAPNVTTALEMHLPLDAGSGTTAQDSTAANHDGFFLAGASWGPGHVGPFAVALNGTVSGALTVNGLLGTPSAFTLAAWVHPTGFPTPEGEVISIGNYTKLRISATQVQGWYKTSGGHQATTAAVPVPVGAWTHLAYTVTAGRQALYVNGVLQAVTLTAAAPLWTGGTATGTHLGRHPEQLTSYTYKGSLDEVRMYSRALTASDVASLVTVRVPTDVALAITIPTSGLTYTTPTALVDAVSGVASAASGVTQVTWTCPTCTPTSGTAVCAPACRPGRLRTTWTLPPLTLALGDHLVTVTAQAAGGTVTAPLTLSYTTAPIPGVCSHWASPAGGGNGLAVGTPFTVAAWLALPPSPGHTLCLLDGTYTGTSGMVTPGAGLSGTSALPLTVQAVNDGAVLLDGELARNPVVLAGTNTWWVVKGLNGRNGLTSVFQFLGSNNQRQSADRLGDRRRASQLQYFHRHRDQYGAGRCGGVRARAGDLSGLWHRQ